MLSYDFERFIPLTNLHETKAIATVAPPILQSGPGSGLSGYDPRDYSRLHFLCFANFSDYTLVFLHPGQISLSQFFRGVNPYNMFKSMLI